MCSFGEKKSEPTEMMQLDGYTVDYTEAIHGMFEGGGGEMVQLDGYTVDVPEAIHGMCERGGDGTTEWVHSGLE